jgi:ABC-type nitrate/sulfonate/bicarbonate transport system substrate-binding protein
MKIKCRILFTVALLVGAFLRTGLAVDADKFPTFTLAWSEYPSWSVFGVAQELGLINGKGGEMGPIEKKWGVHIVLKEADYDTCIIMYGSGKVDAACLTNMDVLNPSLNRRSVGILPTSTSYGGDALIVSNSIGDIAQLRGKNVYGLKKTVSEYCFARNLEILGEKESSHQFTNMDPGAAALAMQQQKEGYDAIVVWNPFVIETLNKRKDVKRMFDSTKIPGEIVDMVQVAQDSLDKPGGKAFACAIIDVFYTINRRLDNAKTRNNTLVDLGAKFAKLDLKSMEKVVDQTRFYATPEVGIQLLEGNEWAMPGHDPTLKGEPFKVIMKRVGSFCQSHDIVPREPRVGYGDRVAGGDVDFRVDPSFIKAYLAGPGK